MTTSKHLLLSLLLIGTTLSSPSFAQSGPNLLNVSGALFNSDGSAVTSASVTFKIEIYDQTGGCLLYSEDFPGQDLSGTRGGFALEIGAGTSINNAVDAGSPTALSSKVFENSGVIAGGWAGCSSGANLADGTQRVIRVKYDTGSGLKAMDPDVPIDSAAYAIVAQTLQGKRPSDFLQVKDDVATDLSQANLENIFSATNYTKLNALVNGTSNQYMVSSPATSVGFNNQRITNVADPSSAQDAATKNYVDANLGGKTVDVTGVGPATGNGYTLIWDQATQKWTTGVPSAIDNTKLPLAGGTMTGAIAMGGNNITNTGHITMAPQMVFNFGTFTTAQETTLVAGLTAAQKGASWYNSTTNDMKVWNGTSAITQLSSSTSAGGDLTGTYPNPTIANDKITSAKVDSAGIGINRLVMSDPTTGANLKFATCAVNEVLRYEGATGWVCRDPSAIVTFPVSSVNGKTGVVVLNANDLGLGTAALENVGVAAGNIPQLDAGGKILASLLPTFDWSNINNGAGKYMTYKPNNTACGTNELLKFDGTNWVCTTFASYGAGDFMKNGSVAMTGDFDAGTHNVTNVGTVSGSSLALSSTGANNGITLTPNGTGIVTSTSPVRVTPTALPATPAAGTIAFDSGSGNAMKYYDGSAWVSIGSGTGDFLKNGSVAMTGNFNAGGNQILGNTTASANLTLDSTSNATKGIVAIAPGGGNVGIGTSTPARVFTLGQGSMQITSSFTGFAANDGTVFTQSGSDFQIANLEAGALTFHTNTSGTERMRIDSAGNVGIGTNSPSALLDVNNKLTVTNSNAVFNAVPIWSHRNSSTAYASSGALPAWNMLLNNTASSANSSAFLSLGTNNNTANTFIGAIMPASGYQAAMVFGQQTGASTYQEAMRIDTTGFVGIGTTAPARLLHVNGPMRVTPSALPGSPSAGDLAFDSGSANALKFYDGSAWQTVGTGTGSGDFMKNGSVAMTGNFNGGGNSAANLSSVGIGTATASNILDIYGNVNTATGVMAAVTNQASRPAQLLFSSGASLNTLKVGVENGSSGIMGTSGAFLYVEENAPFGIFTQAAERLRVTGAGNVGIGTSTPAGILDVRGGTAASGNGTAINLRAQNGQASGNTNGGDINIVPGAKNGTGQPGIVAVGTGGNDFNYILNVHGATRLNGDIAAWAGWGNTYTSSSTSASYPYTSGITFNNNQNVDARGPFVKLVTSNTAAQSQIGYFGAISNTTGFAPTIVLGQQTGATAYDERMRIDGNGNVGIGTTAPARLLHVNGPMRITPAALPSSPAAGELAFDSGSANALKFYDGSAWQTVGTGTGSGDFMKNGSVAMTGNFNAGGNSVLGNTTASANLNLESTSNATKGYVNLQPNGGSVGIGTTTPSAVFSVAGSSSDKAYFFYDNGQVPAGTDGASLYVYRRAAAGDKYIRFYNYQGNWGSVIDSNNSIYQTATGSIYLRPTLNNILEGAATQIGASWSVNNPSIYHYGYITEAGGAKYTKWQVNDTTNNYELSRQDSNIGYLDLQMPALFTGGNVGIGTTSPARALHVNGPIRVTPAALPGTPSAGDLAFDSGASNALKFYDGSAWQTVGTGTGSGDFLKNGTVAMTGNFNAGGNSVLGNTTASANLQLESTSNATKGYVLLQPNGGSVGIGTTTPGALLDIIGTDNLSDVTGRIKNLGSQGAKFEVQTTGIGGAGSFGVDGSSNVNVIAKGGGYATQDLNIINQNNKPITLQTNNTERVRITGAGYVGIGTTTPSDPLHVVGDAHVQGSAAVDANLYVGYSVITTPSDATLYNPNSTTINYPAPASVIVGNWNSTAGTSANLLLSPQNNGSGTGAYISAIQPASGYAAPIAFGQTTGAAAYTERMRIDESGRVGIGTTAPARLLHVNGPMRITPAALPSSPAAGELAFDSGSSNALKFYDGSAWQTVGAGSGDFLKNGTVAMTGDFNAGGNRVLGNSTASANLELESTSNATKGYLNLQSNGGNVGIGTASPSNLFTIYSKANTYNVFSVSSTGTASIDSTSGLGRGSLNAANMALGGNGFITGNAGVQLTLRGNLGSSAGYDSQIVGNSTRSATSAASGSLDVSGTFSPTSGTGTWNTLMLDPTINQTGGANGVSRGIYINPTLTAAADYRAIETVTGNVIFGSTSGNVGIGTTNPARLLHVNGPMRITPAALPSSPAAGELAFDSGASNALKYHNGTTWVSLAGGSADNLGNHTATQNLNMAGFNIVNGGTDGIFVATDGTVDVGASNGSTAGYHTLFRSYRNAINNRGIGLGYYADGSSDTAAFIRTTGVSTDLVLAPVDGSGNPVEKFRLTSTGNVGIGTNAPQTQLANTSTNNVDAAGTGTTPTSINFAANNNGYVAALYNNVSGTGSNGLLIKTATNTTNIPFAIDYATAAGTQGTGLFRVLGNGNVGIGSVTPEYKLSVYTAAATTPIFTNLNVTGQDANGQVSLASTQTYSTTANATNYSINASISTNAKVNAGVTNSGYAMGVDNTILRNYNTTSDNGALASIFGSRIQYGHYNSDAAATPTTTSAIGLTINPFIMKGTVTNMYDILLGTVSGGGTVTNRWAIYQADTTTQSYFGGKVGIGSTTPAQALDVVGNIAASTAMYSPAYYYSSDARLKDHVQTIENPLEKVNALRGVDFNWKESGEKDIGFIAQEVEQVLPEMVKERPDNKLGTVKTVKYGNIIALAIEAIKELWNKLTDVEGRVAKLEQENAELKSKHEAEMRDMNERLEKLERKINSVK